MPEAKMQDAALLRANLRHACFRLSMRLWCMWSYFRRAVYDARSGSCPDDSGHR